MDDDLRRVFFHELGHFVAREINRKKYGDMWQTKEIKLYSKNGQYGGEINPIKYYDEMPVIPIAEAISISTYGCFFESVYCNGADWNECFCDTGECHGYQDAFSWRKALSYANNNVDLQDEILQNDLAHYEILKQKKY